MTTNPGGDTSVATPRRTLLDVHLPLHDQLAASLDGDDDMEHKVIAVDADGHTAIFQLVGFDPAVDEARATVVLALREFGAVAAIHSSYGWILTGGAAEDAYANDVAPSEHPERREVCNVTVVDADGASIATSPVVRSADHQMLGEWEVWDEAEFSGRIVEMLRAGIAPAPVVH